MPESTLSVSRSALAALIGWKIGVGRDSSAWSSNATTNVTRSLEAGLRSFYGAHDWTFLHPVATLSTISGQDIYDLPDDFTHPESDFTWNSTTGSRQKIKWIDEGRIREMRQGLTMSSGWPAWAGLTRTPPQGIIGTRYQVRFERPFDASYSLEYKYRAMPSNLTDDSTYPHGGADHAETIIAACLAAAEWQIEGNYGMEHQMFQEKLAGSIQRDDRLRPWRAGYNGDGPTDSLQRRHHIDVILNGVNLDA